MTGNEIVGHGVADVPPPRPTTYLFLGETRGRAVTVAGESRRSARRRRGGPSRRSGSRAGLPFDAASMKIETGLVSGSRRSMGIIWVTGGVESDPRNVGVGGFDPDVPWVRPGHQSRPGGVESLFAGRQRDGSHSRNCRSLRASPGREVAPRLNSGRCGTRRRGPSGRAGQSYARCCGACGHE